MRNKAVPAELYEQGPVVTFNAKVPKIEGIELPLAAAHPIILRSPKGIPIEYLISYKPIDPAEDNVSLTRHCYYVDKKTYDEIVAAKEQK